MRMIVSPSMSLLAAGVASGICFFLLSTMRRGRKHADGKKGTRELLIDDSRCACCFKPFLVDRGVRCSDCSARSCRKGCSRWDTEESVWHCLFCHQQRCWLRRKEKWFETFGGRLEEEEFHRFFNTAKSRVYVAGVENAAASSGSSLAATSQEETHTMETVRDFVEKIVEGLIGSVDDTPIDRLYDHPAYDKLLAQFVVPMAGALTRLAVALQLSLTNKPTTDPPTMAHTALREIVERAVVEARKLPGLSNSTETRSSEEGRSVAEHSYEDLLATAILNKVIEKFQREQVDGNSNVLHEKLATRAKPSPSESELGLDEGVEEGCSSLEPLSQDEYSDSSVSYSRQLRNRTEPMSLTIEERIEEVTTTYTSDEEHRGSDVLPIRNSHRVPFPELGMDIIDPSQESSEDSQDEPSTPTSHIDMVSPVESWEENWLFQKKKIQKQADPVAMLVPHPSADFKALIGDKDAEDTSDLSECSSAQSDEEIEKELMEAISNVIPRSPRGKEFRADEEMKVQTNGFHCIPQISVDEVDAADDLPDHHVESNHETENLTDVNGKCEEICEKEQMISNYCMIPGETNETKEIEMKSETRGDKIENDSVPVEIIDKTVECESKEPRKESVEVSELTGSKSPMPNKEIKDDIMKSYDENSTNKSVAETPMTDDSIAFNVPKAPTCTPIRASVDDEFNNESEKDAIETRDEMVLNSLESAKKILMVNDEEGKLAEDEAKESTHQKVYLAEDAQQESEYTEHYDIATQRHLDSLTKTDGAIGETNETKSENDITEESAPIPVQQSTRQVLPALEIKPASLDVKEETTEDDQLFTPPRPGTIAEREHKKWENAAPIENNPYSEENIQRRLWERQYSRRLSDIPGAHTELPKSNGADLDVDLTPNQPDMTRFGRDYYINNAKSASGDRGWRTGSSRPESSLSQRSSSTTGADHEQQNDSQYQETENALNGSSDVKSKVAKWQNNIEANYQSILRRSDSMKAWEEKRVEEMLEHERKNSKNEINAKLNNQENYDSTIIDTSKTYTEESQKKVRRIDLKAYGFENEFLVNASKTSRPPPKRVVNKLDLKSFGYDGGLRRSQSNNHLDSTVNESDFKPRLVRASNKSNLTRNGDYHQNDDCHSLNETPDSTESNLTQSSESLNKLHEESYGFFGVLKTTKSVPNITKCEYYSTSSQEPEEEKVDGYSSPESNQTSPAKNYALEKLNLTEKLNGENNHNHFSSEALSPFKENEEMFSRPMSTGRKLPMPSVRKLAEAFSKRPESTNPKGNRTNGTGNGRSSTPEIQIVETPRQMHSLTARSLSKKFREGLRQIPNKVTSPPASHVTMEQVRTPESQTDIVPSKLDRMLNDTDVISPGKLKSNIIFWEQMQRRS